MNTDGYRQRLYTRGPNRPVGLKGELTANARDIRICPGNSGTNLGFVSTRLRPSPMPLPPQGGGAAPIYPYAPPSSRGRASGVLKSKRFITIYEKNK